ncbi:methyltransferase type 11 protein [Pyrenophora tritici-repentis]|nr:methyltransferase type 11 protein [Pyrenophora tritici-repentis]
MSEDTERVDVHGRVFQRISLDDRIYFAPVAIDDREESRLTAQHELMCEIFGDRLFSPRIPVADPRAILECGYGGGDWAVQCAEEFEDCEVTAIDIFPMPVTDQPDNLELIGYNLNDPLRDPEVFQANQYDLIHSRFVFPGIKTARWARYIRDMRLLLRPGGWVQIVEYIPIIQSHNGRLTDESAVRRWWQSYQAAMLRADRDPRIGRRLGPLLLENRYRDVEVDVEQLHVGAWSPDPAKASLGRQSAGMVGDLLESLGVWPFTAELGWTAAQFDHLMGEVRQELGNTDLKLYIEMP